LKQSVDQVRGGGGTIGGRGHEYSLGGLWETISLNDVPGEVGGSGRIDKGFPGLEKKGGAFKKDSTRERRTMVGRHTEQYKSKNWKKKNGKLP